MISPQQSPPPAAVVPNPDPVALEAKRKAIIAAIAAARLAHAEAEASREERRQRKVCAEDLFGSTSDAAARVDRTKDGQREKTYRMQGEFGAKKFIKP